MTVKALIEKLQTYPPECECICTRCSDYMDMTLDDVELVDAVAKPQSGYIMRAYPSQRHTMSPDDQANVKQYVHFTGN